MVVTGMKKTVTIRSPVQVLNYCHVACTYNVRMTYVHTLLGFGVDCNVHTFPSLNLSRPLSAPLPPSLYPLSLLPLCFSLPLSFSHAHSPPSLLPLSSLPLPLFPPSSSTTIFRWKWRYSQLQRCHVTRGLVWQWFLPTSAMRFLLRWHNSMSSM